MLKQTSGLQTVKPSQLPEFGNIAIGGVAGAGKTHLLGTVGKGKKILVIDSERGTETYRSKFFQSDPAATEVNNIDIIRLDDAANARELVFKVESVFDHLIKTKNKEQYELVALDSLTEFQERFIRLDGSKDPRQSYGALKEGLWNLIHKARLVPAHTVFTARLRAVQDEIEGRELVRFDISPSAWSVTSGLFSGIGYMSLRGLAQAPKRVLDFTHNARTQGKDRWGVGVLEKPTARQLLDIISSSAAEKAA